MDAGPGKPGDETEASHEGSLVQVHQQAPGKTTEKIPVQAFCPWQLNKR